MAATRWSLVLLWIRTALLLVAVVLVVLYAIVGPQMRRLSQIAENAGLASREWSRSELWFEIAGGLSGVSLIVVVWLMVAKPA